MVGNVFAQGQYFEGKNIRVIVGQAAGGLGANRVKVVVPLLQKYIPGKPHIVTEYMDGAGGQKAANYVHKTARPDGLTIGFWSAGTVPADAQPHEWTPRCPQDTRRRNTVTMMAWNPKGRKMNPGGAPGRTVRSE